VAAHTRDPGWLQEVMRATHAPDAAARQRLDQVRTRVPEVFGAAVGAVLLARAVRQRAERRRDTIQITYPQGQTVVVPVGFSVLDASRCAKIPHASVCGGARGGPEAQRSGRPRWGGPGGAARPAGWGSPGEALPPPPPVWTNAGS